VWWWRYAGLTDAKTSTLKPEQVGFAPLPSMPGKPATTYTNTWFYGLNRNSARKDAAMEFLAWLTQPEIERDLLLDKTKNEVVAVQVPNLINGDVNVRFGGMHVAAAQSLKAARGVPLFAQWPQVSDLLEAAINDLAAGKGDVKTALDGAAQRARRIMRA
jgi:multiple sugar transport system substrate-binding protein